METRALNTHPEPVQRQVVGAVNVDPANTSLRTCVPVKEPDRVRCRDVDRQVRDRVEVTSAAEARVEAVEGDVEVV